MDSHLNPIIGVGNCLKLGLISFQSPVYTGWNNGRPVSIGVHAVDQNTRRTRESSDTEKCKLSVKPMAKHTSMQTTDGTIPNVLTKDWITNHPKYKHLFSGKERFKCQPVSIEMKPDAELVWKAA